MRIITTQDLIHIHGGINMSPTENLGLQAAMYSGTSIVGTSVLLMSGNTLATSVMAGCLFIPGIGFCGAYIGAAAYFLGPELWNYISSKF